MSLLVTRVEMGRSLYPTTASPLPAFTVTLPSSTASPTVFSLLQIVAWLSDDSTLAPLPPFLSTLSLDPANLELEQEVLVLSMRVLHSTEVNLVYVVCDSFRPHKNVSGINESLN